MSFRTNRTTGNKFPVNGRVIPDKPEITNFEYKGAPFVDKGAATRYSVHYDDGRTVEVDFMDYKDEEHMPETAEELEEQEDLAPEFYVTDVIWDGERVFHERYDANDTAQRNQMKRDLIKRFGKIAEEWLNEFESDVEEEHKTVIEDSEEESLI